MEVRYHPQAEAERAALPVAERVALDSAVDKLQSLGLRLPFPHQSAVRGARVRELRPRSGNSPWRAFYRRILNSFIIGAIGPEAGVDRRGFRNAVRLAEDRLEALAKDIASRG